MMCFVVMFLNEYEWMNELVKAFMFYGLIFIRTAVHSAVVHSLFER